MKLHIVFMKQIQKQNTLKIIRSDGSVSWTPIHPGLLDHDIAHYAVEQILQFNQAFYGLVGAGYEITDFELPKDQKPVGLRQLPIQALQTEHLVNLLQVEHHNMGEPMDILAALEPIFQEAGLPPMVDLENHLEEIRYRYHQLSRQWIALSPGSSLELAFVIAGVE